MGAVLLSIRLLLAATFALAAVGKLLDIAGTRHTLAEFGVPDAPARIAALALPAAELPVAIALVTDRAARWGAAGALVLLVVFAAGIVNALRHGRAPDCHCFGQLQSEPAGRATLARNALLSALACVVVAGGSGTDVPGGVGHLSAARLGLGAATVAVILLALALVQVWGRRRLRSSRTGGGDGSVMTSGLQPGDPAPDFGLVGASGTEANLSDLIDRTGPAVLVFLSTTCDVCRQMAPELALWQESLSAEMTIGVIIAGPQAPSRQLAAEHGLRNVLLDELGNVSRAYGAHLTPSGIVINSDRTVGSSLVGGLPAIEVVIRAAVARAYNRGVLVQLQTR